MGVSTIFKLLLTGLLALAALGAAAQTTTQAYGNQTTSGNSGVYNWNTRSYSGQTSGNDYPGGSWNIQTNGNQVSVNRPDGKPVVCTWTGKKLDCK